MDLDNYPIVLGLAGSAATGKTVTANALAPVAQVDTDSSIVWTHLYFALPLYRISTARQKIQGEDAFDRQCYEIHDALIDIFKGYITYDETVEAVFDIVDKPIPSDGKPRTFLQETGDLLRQFDPDCFVKWMSRKIKEEHNRFEQDEDRKEEADLDYVRKTLGVVISDARFENECTFVNTYPNGVLLKFTADLDVVRERIEKRDGVTMTPEQQSHVSEAAINQIPDSQFTAIIDTSELTVEQQVYQVQSILRSTFNAHN